MSKLTKNTMLELSTGHLSQMTMEHLDAEKLKMSVFIRDEGYMLYAGHYSAESEEQWPEDFPKDLKNCMRFAVANGSEWLMFDADGAKVEEMPYYDDGITPDPGKFAEAHGIPVQKFIFDETPNDVRLYKVVDLERLTDAQMNLGGTPVLEDGDFDAPDGCWLGVGDAAVRVVPVEDGITVSVYRNGDEAGDCLGSVFVSQADLEEVPDETPEP